MYDYTGTAKWFNGHYWRQASIRVKASSYPSAVHKAALQAMYEGKLARIERVVFDLQRLRRTADTDSISELLKF